MVNRFESRGQSFLVTWSVVSGPGRKLLLAVRLVTSPKSIDRTLKTWGKAVQELGNREVKNPRGRRGTLESFHLFITARAESRTHSRIN